MLILILFFEFAFSLLLSRLLLEDPIIDIAGGGAGRPNELCTGICEIGICSIGGVWEIGRGATFI